MTAEAVFLKFSAEKLRQLSGRIHDCLARIGEEQIWARGGGSQNAPGNLVLHLCGNVRQWILSGVGGAPDTRDRDAEFAAQGGVVRQELLARLDGALEDAIAVIASLTAERLVQSIRVQNYEVTVLEAVYHVVEHFAQHTAQIIYATKVLTGEDLGYYAHLAGAHDERTP